MGAGLKLTHIDHRQALMPYVKGTSCAGSAVPIFGLTFMSHNKQSQKYLIGSYKNDEFDARNKYTYI